jgi:mannose-6-phosphate isomerase-like protein (cupin superfamily)
MHERNGASIRNIAEVMWETPPAHYDAHSKMLVNPATAATQRFDFRISSYQPKGYVAPHRHKVQEQIYHVLEGEGLMELDTERKLVRRHDCIFIPPGVEHAIYNTGLRDLVFLVITSPPSDD